MVVPKYITAMTKQRSETDQDLNAFSRRNRFSMARCPDRVLSGFEKPLFEGRHDLVGFFLLIFLPLKEARTIASNSAFP